MFPIDFRTIYFSYIIINIVSLIMITSLYFQLKNRFAGTLFVLMSFIMYFTGNVLVFLRNTIPDWISISVANMLLVSSLVVMLFGFEKFAKKKGNKIHNYILLFVFFVVHSYFFYIKPDLNTRHLLFALTFAILSFQIAFFMLKTVPVAMRNITRTVGILFCVISALQIVHFFSIWQRVSKPQNYFNSGSSEPIYYLAWEIINILLVYSIIMMYNKNLIIDINIQEEKFSKAFHSAPFIIMLSKLEDGKIFEINKSVEALSGYQPNELINNKTTDLQLWYQNEDRDKFISELNSKGKVFEKECLLRKKSGELFTGLVSADIIVINNEQCIISVVSDISNRKITENKLIANESSLRELNSTKDKFFSIIAHDLKSPFNGILGFSEILMEQIKDKDYDGIDKYAEIIHKSSKRAVDLLMNLMDWSRLQTGRMEFNPEYIEVTVMIRYVLELLNIAAEQKSIATSLQLPDKLIIYADKFMFETVLRNLISNAIKFTPTKGNVLISAEENDKEFLFLVQDSGVGIEKKNLEKLFRIGENFSSNGTQDETGTGLGLILCNEFIQKHKGKIWVESEPGVGSSFYFSLPKV